MGPCLGLTTLSFNLDLHVELFRLLEAPIPGLVDGSHAPTRGSGAEKGQQLAGNAQGGPGPQ